MRLRILKQMGGPKLNKGTPLHPGAVVELDDETANQLIAGQAARPAYEFEQSADWSGGDAPGKIREVEHQIKRHLAGKAANPSK